MSHISDIKLARGENLQLPASYSADSHITDFILGITYEIWEQRQIEKIHDYYAKDVLVYSLEGLTVSASEMVEKTHATLGSYPDRILLGDDVIGWGNARRGFSSHRIISPMTNSGESMFGPATGKFVQTMNIADCELRDGRITREWLVRDNLALIRQLGILPLDAASKVAQGFTRPVREWHEQQISDVFQLDPKDRKANKSNSDDHYSELCHSIISGNWTGSDDDFMHSSYAPYCIMRRAPYQVYSGLDQLRTHYQQWKHALPDARVRIDNICVQEYDGDVQHIAVRWSLAGHDHGGIAGQAATGKPVYLLGVTHWKMINGKITSEWTVFDELAVIAQTLC